MAARIYHQEHKRLFQFKEGGSFYTFVSGKDFCLETNNVEKAAKHLIYLDETVSFFGPSAFSKKVGDLFPSFLRHKRKETRASTYYQYEYIWGIFKKAKLDKIVLAKMNQKAWKRFCDNHSHSISDFQNYRNLMHQFLVWCSMHEYIRAVVVLKNPKHKRRKRKQIPNDHALKIFEQAAKSRGGILLYLSMLALLGPRGVEMRKLLKSCVDLERATALLMEDTVKTGNEREIPLHPVIVELLKIQFKHHEKAGIETKWVFPNGNDPKRHMYNTGFRTAWNTCIKKADLEGYGYTMHDWRATYDKWLEMSELKEIQKDKASGKSADVRTKIYINNLTADELRGAESVVQIPGLIELLQKSVTVKPLERN